MNSVVLIGRLAKDPELRFVPSTGMAVARLTLAVDKELFGDKKQQAISEGKPTANFISITVFGKQAENCVNYLAKGKLCAVIGRISTGSYVTQSGEKKYTTDVIANRVEFLESSKDKMQKQDNNENDIEFFDGIPDDNFVAANEVEIPF